MTVEIIEVVVPGSPQIVEIVTSAEVSAIEIAAPGLQGPAGAAGPPGVQGPAGPAVDTSSISLDGGNF